MHACGMRHHVHWPSEHWLYPSLVCHCVIQWPSMAWDAWLPLWPPPLRWGCMQAMESSHGPLVFRRAWPRPISIKQTQPKREASRKSYRCNQRCGSLISRVCRNHSPHPTREKWSPVQTCHRQRSTQQSHHKCTQMMTMMMMMHNGMATPTLSAALPAKAGGGCGCVRCRDDTQYLRVSRSDGIAAVARCTENLGTSAPQHMQSSSSDPAVGPAHCFLQQHSCAGLHVCCTASTPSPFC